MKNTLLKSFIFIFSMLSLQSCSDFIVSGATAIGYSVAQERSVGNAVDDVTIAAQIDALLLHNKNGQLLTKVSVEVHEGRVLLTGVVNDVQQRIEAVRLAWKPNGVSEVINEIKVSDKNTFGNIVDDGLITAQIKAQLFVSKDVRSINYSVETVKSIVYLMGVAQDKSELARVAGVASRVKGVKKVVSYVRIKEPRIIPKT